MKKSDQGREGRGEQEVNEMKKKNINVLSLFDGISCARVALDKAGFDVKHYFSSETDKYAIQVALKNFPDTIQLGDIKEIYARKNGKLINNKNLCYGSKEGIDLFIGGSPCQDLSIAKKNRTGLKGSRSNLFYEYVRLLKEIKPKYFILENVASMPAEAKEIITKIMGVQPIMINASLVSAQTRKRLFWTNIKGITQPRDKGILLKNILEKNATIIPESKSTLKSMTLTASYNKGPYPKNLNTHRERTMVRIGHLNKGGQGDRIYSIDGKSINLSANGGGRGAKTGLYAVALRNRGQGKKPEMGGNKANAITTVQTDSMVWKNSVIRKLTPIECERLQCLPDKYTEGVSNTQRYRALGNAFNVDVVAHILSFIKQ